MELFRGPTPEVRVAQLATVLALGPPSSPPITYKEYNELKNRIEYTYNSSAYQDNEAHNSDDEENEN